MSTGRILVIISFFCAIAVAHALPSQVPTTRAGVATIDLQSGWNLISLPLTPNSADPVQIFAPIANKLQTAYAYEASAAAWRSYVPSAPPLLNDLGTITAKMGLWLFMKEPATLAFEGIEPGRTEIALYPGWNLIGYPAANAAPVGDALSSILGRYSVAYGFDASNDLWRSYAPLALSTLNDLTSLEPSKGYWIRTSMSAALVYGGERGLALTVDKFGDGAVTGSPGGIDCESGCVTQTVTFSPGSTVVLTAAPGSGSTFSHWSGCDRASGTSCTVTVDVDRTVFATFALTEVKIPTTTKVLDEATLQYLLRVEGSIYYFDRSAEAIASLKPGDVIVSGPGRILSRKVVAVDLTAQEIIVVTTDATLADMIEKGTLTLHEAVVPIEGQPSQAPTQFASLSGEKALSTWTFTIPVEVEFKREVGDSLETAFKVSGEISLDAGLDIGIAFDGWDWNCYCYPVREARAILSFAHSAAITGAGVSVTAEEEIWECGFRCLPTIWVLIGPVPVAFQPEIAINVGASVEATVEVEGGLTVGNRFQVGVHYLRGRGWSEIRDFLPQFRYSDPALATSAEAKVYVKPQLAVKVYGIVGPYFSLEGYLKLEAKPAEVPWWTLYGGIGAAAGIEAEVFDKTLADFSVPLWEDDCPLRTLGIKPDLCPLAQASTFTLEVDKSGEGIVASNPVGIDCGPDCQETYNGFITTVTLTATPSPGWVFSFWSGCNAVSGASCIVAMNGNRKVTAVFTQVPQTFTLYVGKVGNGLVTSSPLGINCGPDCEEAYQQGTTINLTANVDPGWQFVQWGGCNSVMGNLCTVTMDLNIGVQAIFERRPPDLTYSDLQASALGQPPFEVGDQLYYWVHAKNIGQSASGDWEWQLALFKDGQQVYGERSLQLSLAPGEDREIRAGTDYVFPTAGTYRLRLTADPANRITESNELNNQIEITFAVVGQPDLTLTSADISWSPTAPSAGQIVTIRAVIRNIGAAVATDVRVQFYDNADGQLQVTVDIGDDLVTVPAGGTSVAEVSWNTQNQGGDNIITVVIDPDDLVTELQENNNQASTTISVQ